MFPAVSLFFLLGCSAQFYDFRERHLNYTSVRGVQNGDTLSFFGIPYAAPPVGRLRFRPPQPPLDARKHGMRDASLPGPSCFANMHSLLNVGAVPAEDCLQLNVFVPANATGGLPVLVYVFGGAFKDSYSTMWLYTHGARTIIAARSVVIVTMNYRMSAFGWLPADELRGTGALNLGIYLVI